MSIDNAVVGTANKFHPVKDCKVWFTNPNTLEDEEVAVTTLIKEYVKNKKVEYDPNGLPKDFTDRYHIWKKEINLKEN